MKSIPVQLVCELLFLSFFLFSRRAWKRKLFGELSVENTEKQNLSLKAKKKKKKGKEKKANKTHAMSR